MSHGKDTPFNDQKAAAVPSDAPAEPTDALASVAPKLPARRRHSVIVLRNTIDESTARERAQRTADRLHEFMRQAKIDAHIAMGRIIIDELCDGNLAAYGSRHPAVRSLKHLIKEQSLGLSPATISRAVTAFRISTVVDLSQFHHINANRLRELKLNRVPASEWHARIAALDEKIRIERETPPEKRERLPSLPEKTEFQELQAELKREFAALLSPSKVSRHNPERAIEIIDILREHLQRAMRTRQARDA